MDSDLFYPISESDLNRVSSCVTEGLDRNTSYFKRQTGKHATLCQPKTETSDYPPLYKLC
jgi:hypothetical protein